MRWAAGAVILVASVVEAGDAEEFVEQYCVSCHSGRRAKADLDLSKAGEERAVWESVRTQLVRRKMPPADSDQPSAAA